MSRVLQSIRSITPMTLMTKQIHVINFTHNLKKKDEYFVELQFIFQMIEEDFAFKLPDSAYNYTTAAVSIIFTNRSLTSNTLDYMPDGTSMLAPFFPYRYVFFLSFLKVF
jgi:hypothetical protein